MPPAASQSTVADPLRLAGGVLLLARSLDQALRGANGDGLTLNELGLMGQIERGVDLPSQLARAMRLDPARVTHLLDRLVEHRYIEREADLKIGAAGGSGSPTRARRGWLGAGKRPRPRWRRCSPACARTSAPVWHSGWKGYGARSSVRPRHHRAAGDPTLRTRDLRHAAQLRQIPSPSALPSPSTQGERGWASRTRRVARTGRYTPPRRASDCCRRHPSRRNPLYRTTTTATSAGDVRCSRQPLS